MTALDTSVSAPVSVTLGDTRRRVVVGVFVLASLLGSTLLFLVQPLVGRLLLPRAGGSASARGGLEEAVDPRLRGRS